MKFLCLACQEKEFSINVQDLRNEQIIVKLVCPNCGAINKVYSSGIDEILIELAKE